MTNRERHGRVDLVTPVHYAPGGLGGRNLGFDRPGKAVRPLGVLGPVQGNVLGQPPGTLHNAPIASLGAGRATVDASAPTRPFLAGLTGYSPSGGASGGSASSGGSAGSEGSGVSRASIRTARYSKGSTSSGGDGSGGFGTLAQGGLSNVVGQSGAVSNDAVRTAADSATAHSQS